MKLAEVRQVRRLSVLQLSEKSGIAYTTIQDIEAGQRKPRMATVRELEKALGVNGQMIDEFRPLLGEPDEFLKQLTPAMLAQDIERGRVVAQGRRLSREEFYARIGYTLPKREVTHPVAEPANA